MKKQIQINDLIFERIKFRYDFYDRAKVSTRNNFLLDTLYPLEFAKAIKADIPVQKLSVAYEGYAISERVSDDMGVKKLHISELVTMLGYTKTDISKMLQAAKNKELNCILVGLGGCVDKDTEYLTPNGWKSISEYEKGDKVMTVDVHNGFKSEYKEPKKYVTYDTNGQAGYRIKPNGHNTNMSMHLSPEHRVVHFNNKTGKYDTEYMSKLMTWSENRCISIPSQFNFTGTNSSGLSNAELKLHIAIAADATLTAHNRTIFKLWKQRKIDRLKSILEEANIEYIEKVDNKIYGTHTSPGTTIRIKTKDWHKKLDYFGYDILESERKIMAQELVHWDGSVNERTEKTRYFTSKEAEADYAQFLLQSTTKENVGLSLHERDAGHKPEYTINEGTKLHKTFTPSKVKQEQFKDGKKYCFTTDTSYWLARKDGYIFVTGNTGSNYLHWLYEMSQWTGKTKIFSSIKAFDDDIFDVPNMLRVPFMPQLVNVNQDPNKTNCIPAKFWTTTSKKSLNNRRMSEADLIPSVLGRQDSTFIYGAPDIGTRTWLSAGAFTFFAATHRDGEYSIVENPTVDNDLMMETYGKINLSKFFLNHLSMTIDFLKYIGSTDREYITQHTNVEIIRKDFDANFADQLVNGFKAGAKKIHVLSDTRLINEIELGR